MPMLKLAIGSNVNSYSIVLEHCQSVSASCWHPIQDSCMPHLASAAVAHRDARGVTPGAAHAYGHVHVAHPSHALRPVAAIYNTLLKKLQSVHIESVALLRLDYGKEFSAQETQDLHKVRDAAAPLGCVLNLDSPFDKVTLAHPLRDAIFFYIGQVVYIQIHIFYHITQGVILFPNRWSRSSSCSLSHVRGVLALLLG